ncbi:MAG: class I SAM-dependent methyltransferase [Caldilineaceae bacterium]
MSEIENLLPLLYAIDADYGWSCGMRAITHSLLADFPAPSPRGAAILEIGCGAGTFLHEVAYHWPEAVVVGTDLHPLALAHASRSPGRGMEVTSQSVVEFAQSDLTRLPFSDGQFQLLLALDVYDQQGVHLAAALAESWRVLAPAGHLLLRVSAYPWLQSDHDRAFQTAHRYGRTALTAAVQAAHFRPLRVTYANSLLAVPVIGLRLLQRWRLLPHTPGLYTDPWSNRVLAAVLRWEARWLRQHNLPGGISLYLIARKEA